MLHGQDILQGALRRATLVVLLGLVPFLGGCYAGLAGIVVGAVAVSSSDGGGEGGAPPAVVEAFATPLESPARVSVEFTLSARGAGALSATVEFIELDEQLVATGDRRRATPAEGAAALSDLPDGQTVRFIWEAEEDLDPGTTHAVVVITPRRDAVEGSPFRTPPSRAGRNASVSVEGRDVRLSFQGDLVVATFDLVDAESDRISLDAASLSAREFDSIDERDAAQVPEEYVPLPIEVFDRTDFPSAPGPGGEQASLSFSVKHPALPDILRGLDLGQGFFGQVCLRLEVRDFPAASSDYGLGCQSIDNNEEPVVDVLPIAEADLSKGVVRVRYRVFDREEDPVSVSVWLDGADGERQRANEFPSAASDGTRHLESLPLEDLGEADNPFHTFLWDAMSQAEDVWPIATLTLVATDREPSREVSEEIVVRGFPGLEPGSELPVGSAPAAFTTGDYNLDGYTDAVVANRDANSVTLLHGGPRGLSAVRTMSVGISPVALATGDLDGDKAADVVVANRGDGTVSFFGGGEGTSLVHRFDVPLGGGARAPRAVVVADFTADGVDDAVVANRDTDNVTLLRGGVGGPEIFDHFPAGPGPFAMLARDFDGDERMELVVTNHDASTIAHFLADPDRGLVPAVPPAYEVGSGPVALAAEDIDGDGLEQLWVLSERSDSFIVFRRGAEGFEPQLEWSFVGNRPIAIEADDFDGDGGADSVLLARGSKVLRFTTGETYSVFGVGVDPRALSCGDHDGDGFPDAVVADGPGEQVFLYRSGRRGLRFTSQIPVGRTPVALVTADFNRDGLADVAVANEQSGTVSCLNGQAGGLSRIFREGVGENPSGLISADFDRDGFDDVVVSSVPPRSTNVVYFRGTVGGLSRGAGFVTTGNFTSEALGDFNGDGYPDLVLASLLGLMHFRGGPSGIELVEDEPTTGIPQSVLARDFDGDGADDLVVANSGPGTVGLRRGGDAGLGEEVELPAGDRPVALTSGDYDGDGIPDLAAVNSVSEDVHTYRGSLENGLEPSSTWSVVARPLGAASGDFDADGRDDLFVASDTTAALSFLRGGPRGLGAPIAIDLADRPGALSSGDFNGDGILDLVVAGERAGGLYLFSGGPLAPAGAAKLDVGLRVSSLKAGNFSSDGFLNLAATAGEELDLVLVSGGPSGPDRSRLIAAGLGPARLECGDFNGDGFEDVSALELDGESLSVFQQVFRRPHVNRLLLPEESGGLTSILDPHHPPKYRLECDTRTLNAPTQVSAIVTPVFVLPQRAAGARPVSGLEASPSRDAIWKAAGGADVRLREGEETYVVAVTDAVRLMRETTELPHPWLLTLAIRDPDGSRTGRIARTPERFRVFRLEGDGEPQLVAPVPGKRRIEMVDLDRRKGVRFSITRFGTYVVAVEVDRIAGRAKREHRN